MTDLSVIHDPQTGTSYQLEESLGGGAHSSCWRASSQGKQRVNSWLGGQQPRQLHRFARAAENENAHDPASGGLI